MAIYGGERWPLCTQKKHGHVITSQTEEYIGVDQIALVARLFIFVQTGKTSSRGGAGGGKGGRALAVGYAALPVQPGTTGLAEGRDDFAQLRVYRAAVITLVVVFAQYFPVCSDLIRNGFCNP